MCDDLVQNVQKRALFLVDSYILRAQFAIAMPRTSGAKSWGPVDVHLTCIAYHSVSAGDTAKADALQDSVMGQYKAAVAAMAIPEHNLHKYFTDPEAQAYLAETGSRRGRSGPLSKDPRPCCDRGNAELASEERTGARSVCPRLQPRRRSPRPSRKAQNDLRRKVQVRNPQMNSDRPIGRRVRALLASAARGVAIPKIWPACAIFAPDHKGP